MIHLKFVLEESTTDYNGIILPLIWFFLLLFKDESLKKQIFIAVLNNLEILETYTYEIDYKSSTVACVQLIEKR